MFGYMAERGISAVRPNLIFWPQIDRRHFMRFVAFVTGRFATAMATRSSIRGRTQKAEGP